jgi:putative transposase
MARKARLVVAGAPHHVYLRGNNRRRLFSSRADRLHWLRCLRRALDKTRCQLQQLTLMTNHVHMIVAPPGKDELSDLVKRACQRYAQLRNAEREASGKLFEERFGSKVITDDAQMMMTTLYNDANAYRAREVRDPLVHEWSTGALHAARPGSRIIASLWTPSPWYLGLGRTASARAAAYRTLMLAYERLDAPQTVDDEMADPVVPPYTRRLERPDRSSAREPAPRYGQKP